MAYDEKAFAEALNENAADDPYSTFIYLVTEACKMATTYQGTMNDEEFRIVRHVARTIDGHDQHAQVMLHMVKEGL